MNKYFSICGNRKKKVSSMFHIVQIPIKCFSAEMGVIWSLIKQPMLWFMWFCPGCSNTQCTSRFLICLLSIALFLAGCPCELCDRALKVAVIQCVQCAWPTDGTHTRNTHTHTRTRTHTRVLTWNGIPQCLALMLLPVLARNTRHTWCAKEWEVLFSADWHA